MKRFLAITVPPICSAMLVYYISAFYRLSWTLPNDSDARTGMICGWIMATWLAYMIALACGGFEKVNNK